MEEPEFSDAEANVASVALEVQVKKRQRKAFRQSATVEAKKVKDFATVTDANAEQVAIIVAKLTRMRTRLADVDSFLLVHGDVVDLDSEIAKAEEYQDNLTLAIEALNTRLRVFYTSSASASALASSTSGASGAAVSSHSDLRKPKLNCDLELMSFDGNPLHWDEFYDDFVNTVDSRQDYSTTDKFKCLKQALKGEALDMIRGYFLTDVNYQQAKDELKERYGDPQNAIFAHFQALLDIIPASNDLKKLTKVRDLCETHIRSLIALGLDEATFGQVFCPIILSKLPRSVKTQMHRQNKTSRWELKNLRELLKDEITARDQAERFSVDAESARSRRADKSPDKARRSHLAGTGSILLTSGNQKGDKKVPAVQTERRAKCGLCQGEHFADCCTVYRTLNDRLAQARFQRLCYVCLRGNHNGAECNRRDIPCAVCKRPGHHRSLCYGRADVRRKFVNQSSVNIGVSQSQNSTGQGAAIREYRSSGTVALNPETPAFTPLSNACVASSVGRDGLSRKGQAVMETCVAPVRGRDYVVKARFVFDTASTRSFIRAGLAKAIGASVLGKEETAIGRLGETTRQRTSYGICSVEVVLPSGGVKPILVSQIESISTPIRLVPVKQCDVHLFTSVNMADGLVSQCCDVQLDILIGLDYYYEFVGPVVATLPSGLVLKSTVVGHILTGFQAERSDTASITTTMLTIENPDNHVYEVERLWSIEEMGIKDDPIKTDDDRALEFFNKTIKFENGRYQVKWLYREGMAPECDNRKLAEGRLRALHRRLREQPEVLQKYDQTIRDQLKIGVVEVAPEEPDGMTHYIPHHHVVKETSTTTKLRVVYDASAKTRKDQHSLNECLYRGPVILADLGGMLLRFRFSVIAITADIEKAFLQIGLQVEDRDVTRFLWLKNPNLPVTADNIVVLRFARVPFGFATSTFLLDGTIAHHLRRRGSALALEVLQNLFVDNQRGGRETVSEAAEYYTEVKAMFSDAALNLREWFSNSNEFMSLVPEEDRGKGPDTRFLGLSWNTNSDALKVTIGQGATAAAPTKRGVLKGIASVFDPCGWFAPATCQGKVLMQDVWKRDLEWDTNLPEDLLDRWKSIQKDFEKIPQIKIARYVGVKVYDKASGLALHCFCDASSVAYGAAIYLVASHNLAVSSTLLFAKARVCPIKEISMPRLELIAVTMGTKLVRYVRNELHVQVNSVYVWTDSKCVLWWIHKESVKERFVENRLNQIRGPDIEFRYVSTSENPADVASRGTTMEKLLGQTLWWNGPEWITLGNEYWPKNQIEPAEVTIQSKATVAIATVEPEDDSNREEFMRIDRFSTLHKLIRTTAQVFRFVQIAKGQRPKTDRLEAADLERATEFWVKRIQKAEFASFGNRRIKCINVYQQLGVYKDENGLLRCRGRLNNAEVAVSAKDPLLLPKDHVFTKLVIVAAHERVLHSGVKHSLAELRQKYWVTHARNQVRSIVHKCRVCKRYQGSHFGAPPPPPLPDFRVSMKRPFAHVGLDYAGPVMLKNGDDATKCWICLFTCASITAIHLELVSTLSTEQFFLALRRFCALHGTPELIVSDNAAQFKSAEGLLRKFAKSGAVKDFSANRGITWKFVTELAPWMGGFTERMVSPVKKALRRCVGKRLVSIPEFQTILYEIAAVVNSRPLVVRESDEVGEHALTPNHFLGGESSIFYGPPARLKNDGAVWSVELLKNWRRLQNVLSAFWKQWQRDYLLSLRERFWPKHEARVNTVSPREGQVVLVGEKNVPRGCWRMARITKLLPSADGLVRSVEIRFGNKRVSRRAIKMIYPLESSEELAPVEQPRRQGLTPVSPDEDEEHDE